ncbi:hypothetical protein NFI96_002778 [Prochilodus magdalenae]|nr:hypothetical protein NFI96_002778 [Prochilodus magdalenae]
MISPELAFLGSCIGLFSSRCHRLGVCVYCRWRSCPLAISGLAKPMGLVEGPGGLGQGGAAATLGEDSREAEGKYEEYGYNAQLSDRISLDRNIPDYRPKNVRITDFPLTAAPTRQPVITHADKYQNTAQRCGSVRRQRHYHLQRVASTAHHTPGDVAGGPCRAIPLHHGDRRPELLKSPPCVPQ